MERFRASQKSIICSSTDTPDLSEENSASKNIFKRQKTCFKLAIEIITVQIPYNFIFCTS